MNDRRVISRIEALDETLFEGVPVIASPGDRRSLLAAQRATARKLGRYTYLEIGSYLGGSLQTHVVDPRCAKIYSIDLRSDQRRDDRRAGCVAGYRGNTTERMMELLRALPGGDPGKVECLEQDARDIPPERIARAPDLAFIDGEHTQEAALSDFRFCATVMARDGAVLFHDCSIVLPAILEILSGLRREGRACLPLKLEDEVFGIFFDPSLVRGDPYLEGLRSRRRSWVFTSRWKLRAKRRLPAPVLGAIRRLRRPGA